VPSSSRTLVGRLVAAGVLVALVAGCTSEVSAEEDPEQVLREALVVMSDYRGIDLRFEWDGDLDLSDVAAMDLDAAVAPLLFGSAFGVRSSATGAAHARIAVSDEPTARDAAQRAFDGLAAIGLSRLGETLGDGDWVRISARPDPQDADDDRVAVGLAEAVERLLDGASTVTHLGVDAGTDRLRVTATENAAQRFVEEAIEVITFTAPGGESNELSGQPGREAGSEAAVDIWVADDRVAALTLDMRAAFGGGDGPPLLLRMDLDELDEPVELPDDAVAFSLRGLLRDLASAAASDAAEPDPRLDMDESAPSDDPAESDEPGESEASRRPAGQDDAREPDPNPLREGGVLDEAFGDENPFEGDEEFDCVTEEDLVLLVEALGPDAVEEVEELLEQGLLVRC
jgi:hypothetical protein